MSPEEWAEDIKSLIEQAEDEGMRFFILEGDFRISGHPWSRDIHDDGVIVW